MRIVGYVESSGMVLYRAVPGVIFFSWLLGLFTKSLYYVGLLWLSAHFIPLILLYQFLINVPMNPTRGWVSLSFFLCYCFKSSTSRGPFSIWRTPEQGRVLAIRSLLGAVFEDGRGTPQDQLPIIQCLPGLKYCSRKSSSSCLVATEGDGCASSVHPDAGKAFSVPVGEQRIGFMVPRVREWLYPLQFLFKVNYYLCKKYHGEVWSCRVSKSSKVVFQYRRQKCNYGVVTVNEPVHWGLQHRHPMCAWRYLLARGKQNTSTTWC